MGYIDWTSHTLKPGARNPCMSELMIYIAEQFNLAQMVTDPTRDLTSNSTMVEQVVSLPRIGGHDAIPMIDIHIQGLSQD